MRYVEVDPSVPLRPYVKCMWILEDPAAAADGPAESVLPDGCIEIVVHYGERFQRVDESGAAETQRRSVVAGQLTRRLLLRPGGPAGILGIRFQPGGAAALLGVAASELTEHVVALGDVWGALADELEDRVCDAVDAVARIASAEALLLARLQRVRGATPEVTAAASLIANTGGRVRIDDVVRHIGWGRRRLERAFRREVGLTPKVLARVIRFQTVVRRIERGAHIDWVGLALDAGYADQAHMVREFSAFAGLPPARFASELHVLSDALTGGSP